MKKIGILGSGQVAMTLGTAFIKEGYEVMLGTSHSEKLSAWKKTTPSAKVGNFKECAAFGELLVLAVKGKVAIKVLEDLSQSISGKTIIDTTNPIEEKPPVNGVLEFYTNQNKSLLELLQEKFPNANFVKAFNSIGAPLMYKPAFKEKLTMFICGESEPAKKEVKEVIANFGFDIQDMGKKEAARPIEALCILWCIDGFKNNDWDRHAIQLIKK